jgi:hypothetical protein
MVLSFVILSPNGEYFVRALDLGRLMGDPFMLEPFGQDMLHEAADKLAASKRTALLRLPLAEACL